MRARFSCSLVALLTLTSATAFAQTGEPIGPKPPSDADELPKGGVVSAGTEGAPTGSGPGEESSKAPAVPSGEVKVVVTEKPLGANPEYLPSVAATHSDFVDTRLTWTFGDDDVLHRTGQTQPLSALPSIGDRPQYRLFFDNLNSRYAGRENLAHLVLYKKMPSWITNVDTEAAVVLRFDMASLAANNNQLNQSLYDAGSYLRIFYNRGKDKNGLAKGLSLVFFPLDTDRFRLGYLYDISWGGTNAAQNQSIFPRLNGSSPGAKVQYDFGDGMYLFGGFKTASITQIQTNLVPGEQAGNEVENVRINETNYGVLTGFGADLGSLFHFDAGGGYFQQGRFEFADLRPPPGVDRQAPQVFTYGGSARLVFHKDMAVPQSVDFLLYRNDPNAPMLLFAPESYKPHELAYSAAVEFTQLEQNLHDPSPTKVGATKLQPARAASLNGLIKAGYLRVGFAAIYRDLPYVLRNQPSFVPFEAIPADGSVKTQSEAFFAGSIDYYIASLHLRPGLGGGLQVPATFSSQSTLMNAQVNHTVVVRQQGSLAILPENESRRVIVQARLSLRWDISDIMAAVGWLQLVHDPNASLITRDPKEGTVGLRTFQSPTFFGFGTTLQVRY